MENKQWLFLGCGLMAATGMPAQEVLQAQRPNRDGVKYNTTGIELE